MNAFLAYIDWNPSLELFHIGSLGVRYYSLCWCIGLILGYITAQRIYKDQRIAQKLFDPLFLYVFIGILAGARLGHCLFYQPDYFLSHPIEMFLPIHQTAEGWKFTGYEGLASHGGTIGVIIALWLYVRKTKLNIFTVLDAIAVATPITACFIRLGNLMNSEIIGKATDLPWAFIFEKVDTLPRHPAQLYEAIAYLLIFVIGLWLYRTYKEKVGTGFFFGYCLTTIFTFRFLVEYSKEVQEAFEASLPIDMGQILSIPFMIIGIYCLCQGKAVKKYNILGKPDAEARRGDIQTKGYRKGK